MGFFGGRRRGRVLGEAPLPRAGRQRGHTRLRRDGEDLPGGLLPGPRYPRCPRVQPQPDHSRAYAWEMTSRCGIPATAVDGPDEDAAGVDILASCTSSMVPTVRPEWLKGLALTRAPSRLTAAARGCSSRRWRFGLRGGVGARHGQNPADRVVPSGHPGLKRN